MRAMNKFRLPLIALLALFLAACGSMPTKKVDMVAEYGFAVRWSDWEEAWQFLHPASGGGTGMPAAEAARLKDVKVSGYDVRSRKDAADGTTMSQVVEIRYIDQATQRELSLRDEQTWRSDDKGKTWFLTSGLPRF